jgi:hypothetical protein
VFVYFGQHLKLDELTFERWALAPAHHPRPPPSPLTPALTHQVDGHPTPQPALRPVACRVARLTLAAARGGGGGSGGAVAPRLQRAHCAGQRLDRARGGGARVEVKIRVKIRVKPRPQCAGRAPLSAAPHPNPSSNLRRASTYARCVLLTLRSTRRSTTRAPRASMRCGASSLRTPQRPNTKPHPNANANP